MHKSRDDSQHDLAKSIGADLNQLLSRLSPSDLKGLVEAVREASAKGGLLYEDEEGVPHTVDLMLRPRVLGGAQLLYLHQTCQVLQDAYRKLLPLWLGHHSVRHILPLMEREERWIRDLHPTGPRPAEPIFGRYDASIDFADNEWVRSFQFFEVNPVGVGGIHFAPTADRIILDHVVPVLQRQAPTLLLNANDDPRDGMIEVLADHARSLFLHRFNVAICQYSDLLGGPAEFPHLVEHFRRRGVNAVLADPRELRLRDGEVYAGDLPIDIAYRDHEAHELASMEEQGHDMSGMRDLFSRDRVVSSLAAEFDHKSTFQVFTSEDYEHYFTAQEKRVFRRHVPWTRVVEDCYTTDPSGNEADLLPLLRARREAMVLKPNRSYGGTGVVLGRETTESEWDGLIETAVRNPGEYVVQAYRPVAEKGFPFVDDAGRLTPSDFFCVLGFFVTVQRLGILGRVSRKKVVNVAQKGGLVAVLRLL